MSSSWSFYSFDIERWNAIFGGGFPGAANAVALSSLWEEVEFSESGEPPELPGDDARVVLARDITQSGIAYDDLEPEDAALLDEMIVGFFSPEGLQDTLAFEPESPDFVNMGIVNDLLRKAAGQPLTPASKRSFLQLLFQRPAPVSESGKVPVRLLPLLRKGRRYGVDQPPEEDAMYVILSPAELTELCKEIRAILALPGEWAAGGTPEVAQEDLLAVFDKVAAKGRWLAGRYC